MTTRAPLTAFIIGLMLVGCQAQARSAQAGYSAADLYNAANAYARAGKPGMAVLHYERARLLAPNDPDIEANLRLVREPLRLPSESRNALARAVTLASPTSIGPIPGNAARRDGRRNVDDRVDRGERRGALAPIA
jgi:hypothetical protein